MDRSKAEAKARAEAKVNLGQHALERFMENCRTWLGDLWEEFNPDGPVLRWDDEVYSMTLPISWNGVKSIVFSGWFGHGCHRPYSGHSAFIKYEIERCYTAGYNYPKNRKASLDLPCGEIVEEGGVRMAEAKPVNRLGMGRLLTETYQAKKTSSEKFGDASVNYWGIPEALYQDDSVT